ncbi:hypothetical protein LTR84_005287 [Exophiala bonariae]|uniref:Uncharacterized protein n=1 Tax=Exophiala bonariae TaxID=1690606 RepID=A0AAV9NTD6_9EURO|nr:hypothetical protein LTR84_005287 [Exophiala bonariae]
MDTTMDLSVVDLPKHFVDEPIIAREVMHDLKFPRILVNSEILSIAMVKRMVDLVALPEWTYDNVATIFYDEFHREIDGDTVEAILKQDFIPTDLPLTHGEHVVWSESPAITHPEFVCGTVIPSGIYWQLIESRQEHPAVLSNLCMERWSFDIDETTIEEMIDEWLDELPRNEDGLPIEPTGDPRPVHPGRRLEELGTEVTEAIDKREEFDIPPPLYSPRPTWGGKTFRHPREIGGSDTNGTADLNIPPFAALSQDVVSPPDYSAGALPPNFESIEAGAQDASPINLVQDFLSTGRRGRAASSSCEFIRRPPPVSAQKHPNWPCCPPVLPFRYTRDDIVEYIYGNLPDGTLIYGNGPDEEPLQFTRPPIPEALVVTTGRVRDYLMAAAHARKDSVNRSNTLIFKQIDTQDPTPWAEIDACFHSTVELLFDILQNNLAHGAVKILYDSKLPPSTNVRELVNHLRVHRGFERLHFWEDNTKFLMSSVLELLQWSGNPAILEMLRVYEEDFPWKFSKLSTLLVQVAMRMLGGQLTAEEHDDLGSLLGSGTTNPGGHSMDLDGTDDHLGSLLGSGTANPGGNSMGLDGTVDDTMQYPHRPSAGPLSFSAVNSVQENGDVGMQDSGDATPARDSPEPEEDQDPEAISARDGSRRLQSAERGVNFTNSSLPSARVARHQRIFYRLSDWLTLLTDIPENRDAGDVIADKLLEYEAEIADLEAYKTYKPRLWSLGHTIEELLTDLEVATFARMYSVNGDGILHWESRFINWLAKWSECLRRDANEVSSEYYLLTHGQLRMMHLPPRPFEARPIVLHRHIVQDLEYVLDCWDGLRRGPVWTPMREHLEALHARVNVGPRPIPTILLDIRFKFNTVLLTLDSCHIVREPAFPHFPPGVHPWTLEDAFDLEAGFIRPSGFHWTQGVFGTPVPPDDTDQPPNRPSDMGQHRRDVFHLAMQSAFECTNVHMHTTPTLDTMDLDLWDDPMATADDDGVGSGGSPETDIGDDGTFPFTFGILLPRPVPELSGLPDYETDDDGEYEEDDDGAMDLGSPLSPTTPDWHQHLP